MINYAGQGTVFGVYQAGAGNETLNAAKSYGAVLASGSSLSGSSDQLIGGLGNDTLVGGVGTTTLTGGAGQNVFEFTKVLGGGSATVTDFTSSDSVVLQGYGGTVPTPTASGSNTILSLSDGTKITFLNVSTSALTGHITSI